MRDVAVPVVAAAEVSAVAEESAVDAVFAALVTLLEEWPSAHTDVVLHQWAEVFAGSAEALRSSETALNVEDGLVVAAVGAEEGLDLTRKKIHWVSQAVVEIQTLAVVHLSRASWPRLQLSSSCACLPGRKPQELAERLAPTSSDRDPRCLHLLPVAECILVSCTSHIRWRRASTQRTAWAGLLG